MERHEIIMNNEDYHEKHAHDKRINFWLQVEFLLKSGNSFCENYLHLLAFNRGGRKTVIYVRDLLIGLLDPINKSSLFPTQIFKED